MIMKNGKRVVEVFKGNVEICTIKHGTDTVFNNTSEYIGTLPVTINSARAENIKLYKFSGNTVQNGTPTPNAPIAVNGVGDLLESGEHAGQYDIPILLNGTTEATISLDKPLYGTGNVLDEYDSTGKVVRKWEKLVLTGNEAWYGSAKFRTSLSGQKGTVAPICTHYKGVTASGYANVNNGEITVNGEESHTLCIADTANQTSINDWKSYLAQQYAAGTPVTVVYSLAIPTEETITAPPLMLSKGTNIVDVDTTVSPTSAYLRWKGYK